MPDIWARALREHWNLDARVQPLAGEYDLNFHARTDSAAFILKVMRPGCDPALIEMQTAALTHALKREPSLPLPRPVPTHDGALVARAPDAAGKTRLVWLQQALPGIAYARFAPHSPSLLGDLGRQAGWLARALEDFDHPALDRDIKWNLMQAGWITAEIDVIGNPRRRDTLHDIADDFAALQPQLSDLPVQAVHNDLNDYNILASLADDQPRITGLIDFGDMCRAPRICDLAIAGAYVVLDHPRPDRALAALVAGYHAANPLTGVELDLLWPLLRMRLAQSVVNSTLKAQESPDDPYVVISQAPAWRFLDNVELDPEFLRCRLRAACGLPVSDTAGRVAAWLNSARGSFAPVIDRPLNKAPTGALSVAASATPRDPFAITAPEAASIGCDLFSPEDLWLGFHGEPRLIYTAPAFRDGRWRGSDRRTVHLGVDIFAPAGTEVFAPLDAKIALTENRKGALDYGGMAILRHETPEGDAFFTLYGHLDPASITELQEGQTIVAGQPFARLGSADCNGGWAPHLHIQLALTLAGMGHDWPGVADPDERALWIAICPNPAPLLNIDDTHVAHRAPDKGCVRDIRARHFGGNLKLSYREPLMLLRGWRHHLFDEWGRPYLDAYNNVPHVGHAHPRIQAAVAEQLKRMNSNTRYLHPAQADFAEKLLSKLPLELSVCWFVNSGTEANELALRLARAATGGRAMVTPDHGYHGNTTGAMDISAYKFNAPGGAGQPDWVELVELPDDYRGRFRREDPKSGARYAAQVDAALEQIAAKGQMLAGFIAESFPSVGGQIIPPPGYLQGVYARIRAAGGVCIADEVQTGLGRLGAPYFAFETQGVVPDMVVLGKPIGNGHPLGVVISTREIAEAFAKGPEFFSTFGGSTLSCVVGKTVLDITDEERLAENAEAMGQRLLTGLQALAGRFEIIGDVRGMGLFIGVDLVQDRDSRAPATAQAAYVMNRLREERILIGREGPADNILKIRPPLTIDEDGVDMLLDRLGAVLAETGAAPDAT